MVVFVLIAAFIVVCVFLIFAVRTKCTIASFHPTIGMHSRLTGADAHARLVAGASGLPGVRVIDTAGPDTLLSVRPVASAKDRGLGMYVVIRDAGDEVVLLARRRVPVPAGDLGSALSELEQLARTDA
jgi:hypothetical protein